MKQLLFILCLLPSLLFAATGDITSCTVRADGWSVDLVVEGFTTGATYDFDLDANNEPESTAPYLTVVSQGYDATGTLGTVTRIVWMTSVIRKAYPNEASLDETGGGNLTVRLALSDYVYIDDNTGAGKSGTAPTVTLKAGFIVNAGGASQSSAAVTAGAVTNSSTAVYPKVVGNWTWPGYERITGSTFTSRCFAASSTSVRNAAGVQQFPKKLNIACVIFTAADTHSNTDTVTVTSPSVDWAMPDQKRVTEWIATHSSTSLTALDVITRNFVAYPIVGDASSILDTSAGTAQPTPLYGPAKSLCDKSATYHSTAAVVDSATGNDTTGAVASDDDYATAASTPFLTVGKALNKIAAYNNTNYSRNFIGGGKVYMKAGSSYTVMGSSNTYGTTTASDTWAEVLPYPGVSRASIVFTGQSGNFIPSYFRLKFTGVTFTGTGANTIGGGTHIWLDNCSIDLSASGWWSGGTVAYFTHNTFLRGTPSQFSTTVMSAGITRGNYFDGTTWSGKIEPFMAIGNKKAVLATNGNNNMMTNVRSGAAPAVTNWVVAFNEFLGWSNTAGTMISLINGATDTESHGGAFLQNLCESTAVDSTKGGLGIAADSTTGTPVNNIILWNNTFMGVKFNASYNSTGTTAAYRLYWSSRNNIWWDWNQKSDTFTGDGGASGNRIGNWASALYLVNYSGDIIGDEGNGFNPTFRGLRSLNADWSSGTSAAYFKFVDYKALNGQLTTGSAGAGGGDYRLTTSSPAYRRQRDCVLPFDINGKPRSISSDSAGAISEGGVRPASMFFAN